VSLRRLAILCAALAACSSSEERARHDAQQAIARGERGAAIEAIEALHAAAPDTPDALLERAELWIRAGEAPRAVWLLEEGVARYPERADLRLLLASSSLLVGDPARAETVAGAVPEGAPEHPAALLVRARARLELGDLEGGLEAFRSAETQRPDSAELRIPRVAALLEERRFKEARAALDEAYAAFEDESARALLRSVELVLLQFQAREALLQGAAAERKGDAAAREQARAAFDETLAAVQTLATGAPDELAAWQVLAELAQAGGHPERAEPALRAALDTESGRLDLYPLLASSAAARGDEAEALRLLRELALRSGAAAPRVSLARFLAARERRDEAIAELDSALVQQPDDPTLRLAHAELLLDAEQLEAAEQALERFAALRASEPRTELLRARLALARGDAADARTRLEKLAPELDTSATQYWLGRALEAGGDRAGAAHRYRLSAARDATAPGPWLELLRLARQRGDPRESAQAAAALLQRAPGLIDGWEGLVDAAIQAGRHDAALETAQRSAALLPQRFETSVLMARALRASGRAEEAQAELERASERFGDAPQLAAERVLALGLSGRLEEAIAEAQRAIAAHPEVADLHYAVAGVLFNAGRAEEGAAAVDRALALAPDDLRPLATRCRFHVATGAHAAGIRDCGRFLARHPDHAELTFALGVAQEAAGLGAEAEASYRRAASLDLRAAAPRNNLALLLASRGDLAGALEAAQQAYALDGENPNVLDTLGWLYLKQGLSERSISLLEEAHMRAPTLDAAQLHLALAYRANGRPERARELLEALRARGTASPSLRVELDAALAAQ
jgi:tetratricopeptide (TPR) repeat protein